MRAPSGEMNMPHHSETLAALIGSRICHDLISPIGAVANGLELLQLSGAKERPEMALVSDSAAHANARIRLFRLAFGIASDTQTVSADEIGRILAAIHDGSRITLDWTPKANMARRLAQVVLLATLCCEHALPYGGAISIRDCDGEWHIRATGERLRVDPGFWGLLRGASQVAPVPPAAVQFLLLPLHMAAMDRRCSFETGADSVDITIGP